MKFKSLMLGIAFLMASVSSFASDRVEVLSYDTRSNSYTADFVAFGPSVLDGGSDTFTFAMPNTAPGGTYHVFAAIAGFGLDIDWSKTLLNGKVGAPILSGISYDFGYITSDTRAPFVMTLFGTRVGYFQALGGHIDAVSVTSPVAEPMSSLMFGAGLGMMGFIGLRRRKQK